MANQGAKKRREQNRQHMQSLLRLIIFSNVLVSVPIGIVLGLLIVFNEFYLMGGVVSSALHLVARFLVFHSSVTWKNWMGIIFTSICFVMPYKQLANMASPAYDDSGELVDGGHDLSSGGVCGYLHDIIYITCFVQVMSIISGKFWYTYLVIPAFAAYKLSGFLKGWLFQGSEGPVEDEKSRKKREKMEKKAQRPKFMKTRAK